MLIVLLGEVRYIPYWYIGTYVVKCTVRLLGYFLLMLVYPKCTCIVYTVALSWVLFYEVLKYEVLVTVWYMFNACKKIDVFATP